MSYKDLTFLLFAKDMSASRGFEKVAASGDKMATGLKGSMGLAAVAVAGLAIDLGAKTAKMAADFQTATTRLVTDAGESEENLQKVSAGILNISQQVGTGATDIAKGMYYVESAGYHGAAGLEVMRAAAEGAKIGGADLTTVADALTTVMKDYGIQSGQANNTTSELIATVSRGKTTMEDLAGSLHSVLPNAQSLGISLNDVLGALATMTQEGISADQATQNLNHTIVSLANPTHVQAQEMAAMGLNATTVAKNLGKNGLTGTLNELVTAITTHMGKSGLVLQKAFTDSSLAAQSANTMFKHLPGTVQGVADEYRKGTLSQKEWTTAVKAMTPANANLAKQWATTENASKGFSQVLKSGSGSAQTFTAALAKMTGGQTGLQVALHITGLHAEDTAKNVKEIGSAAKGTQKDVRDWSEIQGTFNQQMSEFHGEVDKLGIELGTGLLPALGGAATGAKNFLEFIDALDNPLQHLDAYIDTTTGKVTGLGAVFTTLPNAFHDIGGHIVTGLIDGLTAGWPQVTSAVEGMVNSIPLKVRQLLGIASPSKVMIKLMSYVGEGAAKGLLGTTSQVSAAAATISASIRDAFSNKQLTRSAEQSALATVKRFTDANSRLRTLSAERARITAQLSDLKSSRSGVYSDTKSATITAGDITSYAAPGDAVQGLQSLVAKTKTFTGDLKRLVGKGVKGALLAQLVDGWNNDPNAALQTAEGLLANPTDLKQILSLQGQLSTAGAALGSYAGHAEYDSQISAASARQTVLTFQMQRAAEATLKKIAAKTEVHIHLSGTYAGTTESLAKTVTAAIKDAVKKGQLPKNVLTAL